MSGRTLDWMAALRRPFSAITRLRWPARDPESASILGLLCATGGDSAPVLAAGISITMPFRTTLVASIEWVERIQRQCRAAVPQRCPNPEARPGESQQRGPLSCANLVGRDGIEPPTLRFSAGLASFRVRPGSSTSVASALLSRHAGGLLIRVDRSPSGPVRTGWAERRHNRRGSARGRLQLWPSAVVHDLSFVCDPSAAQSRAWKAGSGRGPVAVPAPNGQVRADLPRAVVDRW